MPEPARDTFLTSQPGKGIYTLLVLLFNITRAPLWGFYYIPSSLRPNSGWSWRQAFRMRIVRAFLGWASSVEMVTPYDLTPGWEKKQWTNISPASPKYYTGVTLSDSSIKPGMTGATWYPAQPAPGEKLTKVILHFHGGAYVIGDGRKADCGFLAKTLLKNVGPQYVVCPNYRLASNAGGRFPAALQDAISAYTYLLNEKNVDPKNITVSGDSAGANLTMALLKYIADNGATTGLPNPGSALLWSLWADPQGSTDEERFYSSPNEPTDYLNPGFGTWGAKCYMPIKSTPLTNQYIDFVHNQFVTPVPLWFSMGESEMLLHDDIEVYENFQKLNPKSLIEMSLEPRAPHDILLVGDKTSFTAEATAAAKKAGAFLKKVRGE